MTIKQKVLFLEKPRIEELKRFETLFECIYYQVTTVEQCVKDFQSKFKDIEAIYCGWMGFSQLGGFRGKLISFAPRNLKIITTCTVGHDHFDTKELTERGIILTNVPSNLAFEAVADMVLYNTIASFRNFKLYELNFKDEFTTTGVLRSSLIEGKFNKLEGKAEMKPELKGSFGEKCCGRANLSPRNHDVVIVGFGNIGRLIGKRLDLIGMNVHYVKRNKLTDSEEKNLGYNVTYHPTIEDTKEFADLIVIACPGSPSTKHIINSRIIDNMKKPFRIINIGRGSCIDENALIQGLKNGKILFAGLDVFENEQTTVNPELIGRQDVVLTPHIGSATTENYAHTALTSIENIETVLLNFDRPITNVNYI
ncbi:uncharacterized protein KGF55_003136 [Candida pseudojiufengensis]|uniref:uncharacterized protein n=1 Tax=Candida pseudojiufengensis TaxID=497109 RepID=UPI00222579EB|nr:uncharacterized protein KGF55_003136 [Candida pseudojiufengensis]KAI5963344.1 hypothetical protein KGF55_003136 [Candida pseudojiufengensis]